MFSTVNVNNISRIIQELNISGVVLIKGIKTEQDFIELSSYIGSIYHHPHSSRNGITYITTKNIKENRNVDSGFTNKGLLFHTDRGTSIKKPPKYMMLHCHLKAHSGGANILSDGYKLIDHLINDNTALYEYLISTTELVYVSGEEIYSSPIIMNSNSEFILRLYFDKRVVKTSYYYQYIQYLYEILMKNSHKICLDEKMTVIINNWRWVHARESFLGNREMWRLLV